MIKYAYWALLFIPQPFLFFIGRAFSPIACLFVRYEDRTDVVKRQNKQVVTMLREYLPRWLCWFETDDNAVDEYWYGVYPLTKYFTQSQYDNSWWIRYFMRVCWLQRNNLYTFNREYFGIAKDSKLAWQYKAKWPLLFGYHNDVNIGFKSHKGVASGRLMFASRIIGIRKN